MKVHTESALCICIMSRDRQGVRTIESSNIASYMKIKWKTISSECKYVQDNVSQVQILWDWFLSTVGMKVERIQKVFENGQNSFFSVSDIIFLISMTQKGKIKRLERTKVTKKWLWYQPFSKQFGIFGRKTQFYPIHKFSQIQTHKKWLFRALNLF